jgi:hypothetical protein
MMIELDPTHPHHDRYQDAELAEFIFDPKNDGLKKAFEKAADVKLRGYMDDILIFSKHASDMHHAKKGLTELAAELRSIPEDRFRHITAKIEACRRPEGGL